MSFLLFLAWSALCVRVRLYWCVIFFLLYETFEHKTNYKSESRHTQREREMDQFLVVLALGVGGGGGGHRLWR